MAIFCVSFASLCICIRGIETIATDGVAEGCCDLDQYDDRVDVTTCDDVEDFVDEVVALPSSRPRSFNPSLTPFLPSFLPSVLSFPCPRSFPRYRSLQSFFFMCRPAHPLYILPAVPPSRLHPL